MITKNASPVKIIPLSSLDYTNQIWTFIVSMKESAQRSTTPLGADNIINKSKIKMKKAKIQCKHQKWRLLRFIDEYPMSSKECRISK